MHEKSTGCFSDRRSGPGKSFVSHFSWLIYQMYDTSEKSTHQLVMLIERPTIRFYGIGNPPHPALSPHERVEREYPASIRSWGKRLML